MFENGQKSSVAKNHINLTSQTILIIINIKIGNYCGQVNHFTWLNLNETSNSHNDIENLDSK